MSDKAPTFEDPDAPIVCPPESMKRTQANTFRELDPFRHSDVVAEPPPGYSPPRMIEAPPVKFPGSLFTRKQGFASIFVVIDVAGAPAEPQVVCSSNEKFELASLEAILATKFAPATQDGRPVEETAIIPFDFKIR